MATKPALRNLGQRYWGIRLGVGLALASGFSLWYKINVLEARKRQYKEFYDNYDDKKEYEAMKKAGIFKGFEAS